MRILFIVLVLAGLSNAAGSRFGGVWRATFKGTVICTLEIEDKGETVTGASKSCNISVDQNGDLLEAEPPDENADANPFLEPKVAGQAIRYEQEEEGETARMKFEFRLTRENTAELRLLNAPIPIKPIRFERRHT